ncbi:hypothetical protein AAC387_Pa02g0948 [Persea americana]
MERLMGLPGSMDQLVPVKQHEVRRFIIIIAIIVSIVPGTALTVLIFLYRKRRGGSRSPPPSLEEAEPPVLLRGPLPVQPSFWLELGRALTTIQEVEEIGSDMEL